MKFWRIAGVGITAGITFLICEYISTTAAVVLVAALVALLEVNVDERLDRIAKALEMHSKRIFPEHW